MNTLAAQQRSLAAAIVQGEPASGLLRDAPDGHPARLHVYQEAYGARLSQALQSNYPVLRLVLGDDGFRDLARRYLHAQPSRRPSIRWFGHRLVEFMHAQVDEELLQVLADLAAMEWALRSAFDAADAEPLAVDDLMRMPADRWPALRFAAHPSVTLLPMTWAVEPLWRTLTADENGATEAPAARAHRLLVWRQGLETRWRTLDEDEARLLQACGDGSPFAELGALAERLCGAAPAARLAGLLRLWVEAGLLLAHPA